MTYGEKTRDATAYYALCRRAERLGIPTSLDDPRSPKTVGDLLAAVAAVYPQPEKLDVESAVGGRCGYVVFYLRRGRLFLDGMWGDSPEVVESQFRLAAAEIGWTVSDVAVVARTKKADPS